MKWYCEKCKGYHNENELCPYIKKELKDNPELLGEAANFTNIAGQYALVSSQTLDKAAHAVNKIAGTNLSFEGTHQTARDIQVFAKLNSDSFRNSGQFAGAEVAKQTFDNASDGFKRYLRGRLNGTGQEIDWLRYKQGKLSSLVNKSTLPDGNTVGYDGKVINRFTGKTIEKVTVKAAEGSEGLYTNAKDIVEALEKGTLNPNDTVYGIEGTNNALNKALEKRINSALSDGNTELAERLRNAQKNLKVTESNTMDSVKSSTERLTEKIKNGQATPTVDLKTVGQKAANGAVIGAAVGLTVSSITNYIRYKKGEITEAEAFRDVGEDTLKSAITGGAMGAITLFLPGGVIGFASGMAIGIYIGSVCTNILDEIFGKGAYEQILNSCGYVAGTARNACELLENYGENVKSIDRSNAQSKRALSRISQQEKKNQKILNELNDILGDL